MHRRLVWHQAQRAAIRREGLIGVPGHYIRPAQHAKALAVIGIGLQPIGKMADHRVNIGELLATGSGIGSGISTGAASARCGIAHGGLALILVTVGRAQSQRPCGHGHHGRRRQQHHAAGRAHRKHRGQTRLALVGLCQWGLCQLGQFWGGQFWGGRFWESRFHRRRFLVHSTRLGLPDPHGGNADHNTGKRGQNILQHGFSFPFSIITRNLDPTKAMGAIYGRELLGPNDGLKLSARNLQHF